MKRVILVLALVILGCTSAPVPRPVISSAVAVPYFGPDGAIRGIVLTREGAPLPGVTIVLHRPQGDLTKVTDAQGKYEFLAVTPGTYLISARLSGFGLEQASVPVKTGISTGVTMTLGPEVMESIKAAG